jgi:hypothetical protein
MIRELRNQPMPSSAWLPRAFVVLIRGPIVAFRRLPNPGRVFDLVLPLDEVAEGYRAMDERPAIKTLLKPRSGRKSFARQYIVRGA